MAFGSFNPQRQQSMVSDINVTPLVDVMLVLLVIFIITAPMFTHAVKLQLPAAVAPHSHQLPGSIMIAIDAAGAVYWDEDKVDLAQLARRMALAAAVVPAPELQLRADRDTRYEIVAQVMATAQLHGLTKIGFITEPHKEKQHGQR
ncbi:MAG: biopolymer transporter ExbD [Telluria sp.]